MGGLKLLVAHVGSPRLAFIREGVEHFRGRIRHLAALRLLEVREEALRKGMTPQEVQQKEQKRLEGIMDRRYQWVVLDENGQSFRSAELAALLDSWMQHGKSQVAFLVAGPCGLSPEILARAELRLSLSPLTYSHETALLVLLEQLYRILAILNRLPYPR